MMGFSRGQPQFVYFLPVSQGFRPLQTHEPRAGSRKGTLVDQIALLILPG